MKHSALITLILILVFFTAQVVGLAIIDKHIDYDKTTEEQRRTGNLTWENLPLGIERPEIEESASFLFIAIAIFIGTALVLMIIKLGAHRLWKIWYFLSIFLCLTIALKAFIPNGIALLAALILASLRLTRPSVIAHNIVELFVYGGIAAIVVPMLDIFWAGMLLILISIYDAWAVWHSKHMVTLARFQTKQQMFSGLMIPYKLGKQLGRQAKAAKTAAAKAAKKAGLKAAKARTAVLGGGDIGFPLIFAGVIMKYSGFFTAIVITIFATIALAGLLFGAKSDRYYPAMPYISAGCFAGYLVVLAFI